MVWFHENFLTFWRFRWSKQCLKGWIPGCWETCYCCYWLFRQASYLEQETFRAGQKQKQVKGIESFLNGQKNKINWQMAVSRWKVEFNRRQFKCGKRKMEREKLTFICQLSPATNRLSPANCRLPPHRFSPVNCQYVDCFFWPFVKPASIICFTEPCFKPKIVTSSAKNPSILQKPSLHSSLSISSLMINLHCIAINLTTSKNSFIKTKQEAAETKTMFQFFCSRHGWRDVLPFFFKFFVFSLLKITEEAKCTNAGDNEKSYDFCDANIKNSPSSLTPCQIFHTILSPGSLLWFYCINFDMEICCIKWKALLVTSIVLYVSEV